MYSAMALVAGLSGPSELHQPEGTCLALWPFVATVGGIGRGFLGGRPLFWGTVTRVVSGEGSWWLNSASGPL